MLKYRLLCLALALIPSFSFAQTYTDKAAEAEALKKREIYLKESQGNSGLEQQKKSTPQVNEGKKTSQGQFIACPLGQIETKVKTPLPAGWWDTPQVGKLQNTAVINMGGKATLQCFYWAYDKSIPLMKLAPQGKTCRAEQGGFSCQ